METKGTELHPVDRRIVLAGYGHRYTQERKPDWARGTNYRPQFIDDADWLANTRFRTRKDGRLDNRCKACWSSPTWPEGKGINGQKGRDW